MYVQIEVIILEQDLQEGHQLLITPILLQVEDRLPMVLVVEVVAAATVRRAVRQTLAPMVREEVAVIVPQAVHPVLMVEVVEALMEVAVRHHPEALLQEVEDKLNKYIDLRLDRKIFFE